MVTAMFGGQLDARRVLLTGHTGFKGSWLATWLSRLGAEVHGVALEPEPHETLFSLLGLKEHLASDLRVDVRDRDKLRDVVADVRPEIVLHLAAQPLVRKSFAQPVETFSTNVMGTVNLLDAIRLTESPCSVVIVTTDKCYENREWVSSYRETDAMGGHDPYSASKGCAELVVSSYRRSFFSDSAAGKRVASARAGNVIGGGDWATDRIVPDIFRAVFKGKKVPVRNRLATRPWQHVLEPLSGYLWLAALLAASEKKPDALCTAFNFGPSLDSNRTVLDVVQEVLKHATGQWSDRSDPNAVHEASKLNLAIDRAHHMLDWKPVWDFSKTVEATAQWYLQTSNGTDATEMTLDQIAMYETDAQSAGLLWATSRAL